MRNIDHENDEPAVIDVAQDSVVTDPVSPHACQVSRQCLAPASWVFELRYLVKLVKHPRGNALIELAYRLVGVPREINSPGPSSLQTSMLDAMENPSHWQMQMRRQMQL